MNQAKVIQLVTLINLNKVIENLFFYGCVVEGFLELNHLKKRLQNNKFEGKGFYKYQVL